MRSLVAAAFPGVLLLACGSKGAAVDSAGPPPTWSDDVAPILGARCAGCHADGGIGPMPLTTYAEVQPYADWVADAVASRRMPPGQVADDCAEYTADPSLTDDERDTIARWAAEGTLEGDADVVADASLASDPLALSRVDLRIELAEPYTPSTSPDDYRCFLVDWPMDEDTYVTGFGVEPGEAAIVHHVIAFVAPPDVVGVYEALDEAEEGDGYTCFGGPGGSGMDRAGWMGGWVPGKEGRDMPEGTGIAVQAGSKIIVQVHYNTNDETAALSDQTALLIKVDDAVEQEARLVPVGDPLWMAAGTMEIPAGELDVTHSFTIAWPVSSEVHQLGMHMHQLGQSGSVTVAHADGTESCLVRVEDWDFNWQMSHRLAEPVLIAAGDELTVSCTFDNPTDEAVNWGEGTSDEMCLGILYLTEAE